MLNSLGKLECIRQVVAPPGADLAVTPDLYRTRFSTASEWQEALHDYARSLATNPTPAMPHLDGDLMGIRFRAPDSTAVHALWDQKYSTPILRVSRASRTLPGAAMIDAIVQNRIEQAREASLYWEDPQLEWLHAQRPEGKRVIGVHGQAALFQAHDGDDLVDTLVTPQGWFTERQHDIIAPGWMKAAGAPPEAMETVRQALEIPSLWYAEPRPKPLRNPHRPPKHPKPPRL